MSKRERFLALADKLRYLPGPETACGNGGFDVRPNRVLIRRYNWSSGKIRTGASTITDLEILPRPHVVATSGTPVMMVGPITPYFAGPPSGGYTPEQLNLADAAGMTWNYVIIGPDAVERPYKLMALDTSKPLRYMLSLTSLDRKVPY